MGNCRPLARIGPLLRLVLTAAILAAAVPLHASESGSPDGAPNHMVAPSEADLEMITLEVMKQHPIVASSPGIKYASGNRGYQVASEKDGMRPTEIVTADVIFHPHSETAGVRNALQAHCRRESGETNWTCPVVELRRYVQLEGQDFEVRVKADLGVEAVVALVEATRGIALSASQGAAAADTAQMVLASGEEYFVAWSDRGHHQTGVLVKARLIDGGNPAERDAWVAWLAPTEPRDGGP